MHEEDLAQILSHPERLAQQGGRRHRKNEIEAQRIEFPGKGPRGRD
jgi:hypothetical protein